MFLLNFMKVLVHTDWKLKTNKWRKIVSTTTDSLRSIVTRFLTSWHFPWWNHMIWGKPQPVGLETWSGRRIRVDLSHNRHTLSGSTKNWSGKPYANDNLLVCKEKWNYHLDGLLMLAWSGKTFLCLGNQRVIQGLLSEHGHGKKGARYMLVTSGWLPTEDIDRDTAAKRTPQPPGQCLDGWTFTYEAFIADLPISPS